MKIVMLLVLLTSPVIAQLKVESTTARFVRITVKITKDALHQSAISAFSDDSPPITNSCPVAVAVHELFPKADVSEGGIVFEGLFTEIIGERYYTTLPISAINFIHKFDRGITLFYQDRYTKEAVIQYREGLPEFEFEIKVPLGMIEKIGIPEVERIISQSETLSLTRTK